MAWRDADQTVVGSDGEVYVAPVGTALPANAGAALNAAFVGLGFLTEDGVGLSHSPDVAEFGAWQARNPIRIERQSNDFRATVGLLQWDEETVKVAFGGGTVSDLGSGQYKYTPPDDDDALDERSYVIDVNDGADRTRIVIPRGAAIEAVETSFSRSALSSLPVTIRALEPETGGDAWYALFNDAAFASTGS